MIKVDNRVPGNVIVSGLDHNEVLYIEVALEIAFNSGVAGSLKDTFKDLENRLRTARRRGPIDFP